MDSKFIVVVYNGVEKEFEQYEKTCKKIAEALFKLQVLYGPNHHFIVYEKEKSPYYYKIIDILNGQRQVSISNSPSITKIDKYIAQMK